MKPFKLIMGAALLLATTTVTAPAQAQDMSPVLLIETGPSDNPEYRRMTFTKFLEGNRVRVAYKSYNRSEFIQVRDTTPQEMIDACARGASNSFSDVKSYEASEARAKSRGQTPEVKSFCIKNIPNWEGGNRTRYLDPIFNGMPYAKTMR